MSKPFNLTSRLAGSTYGKLLKDAAVAITWVALPLVVMSGCQFEEVSPTPVTAVEMQASPDTLDPVLTTAALPASPIRVFDEAAVDKTIPDWVAEAVFYQIFPERFRNGDPSNDPTHASLEDPDSTPTSWKISPWTGDWYARAEWEQQAGANFYDHGVFNRRYGGDLQGILDKLDYLHDLGINTIYLNPVFYGKSLHKYDAASMHHIDPYFGPDPAGDLELMRDESGDPATWHWTTADKLFLELIEAAHKRNIRLIIDGVFNHTGRAFFAFADILENQGESQYQDWYLVQSFDDPTTKQNELKYKSWWGYESLPEFADSPSGDNLHRGPKQYVFDITRRWMDPNHDGDPSDGVDGWRLDVANEVPIDFWRDWNTLVRELNPEAYTVGEFWNEALDHLLKGRFSATMNYHGFAYLVKGFLIDGTLAPGRFGQELQSRRQSFPLAMQYALQNLIDSHDTDRMASMIVNAGNNRYHQPDRFDYDVSEKSGARNNKDYEVRRPNARERKIQRLVALMQMTYVGAPMVYYGTEAGMWGGDDPCDRMPMVWSDLTYQDQAEDPLGRPREADSVGFDPTLFDYYRRVIQLRKDNSALSRGKFELVDHDDESKFISFRRQRNRAAVLVAINRGEHEFEYTLPLESSEAPRQIFSTEDASTTFDIRKESERWVVTMPPLSAAVFDEQASGK